MEQKCPRCKTSSYQNPNMKLMVNICGHRLCESCVDSVFLRPSAACPECGVALRRNQFRLQQFEDSHVEKEVDIRKRILKDYNKTESDFSSLREYNDYLEDVEAIIYNLTNGVDVDTTKFQVETYKKENQSTIMKNRARQLRHEQVASTNLQQQRVELELRNKMAFEVEEQHAKLKKKQKESIIDELMTSDRPASEVLASHAAVAALEAQSNSAAAAASMPNKAPQLTFQEQMGTTVFEPLPDDTGALYHYQTQLVETCGPGVPDLEELDSYGYMSNVRALQEMHAGGGFVPAYACQRALQDAFSCLFLPDENR